MKKTCITILMLYVAINSIAQKTNNEINTLNTYKACLLNSDKSLIPSVIASKFRLAIYQAPMATKYFEQFIDQVQQNPTDIYWDSITEKEGVRSCKVHYVFNDKEDVSHVVFSEDGKLLYSDYLDVKGFNFNRYAESKKIATLPFTYNRGAIIVKAKLNGKDRVLNLMFDTGADGLALKADLQDEMAVKITEQRNVFVPGGQMKVNFSSGNTVTMGNLELTNQNLVLFPKIKPNIDGILGGSNLFRNYITEVNFERSEIVLYTFGNNSFFNDYNATNITYSTGVPTIPLNIYSSGKHFTSEFILDAGAGYQAIMFGSGTQYHDEKALNNSLKPLYESHNLSVGHKSPIKVGIADSINFAGLSFKNASLAVESYQAERHKAHNVKGSIGIQFLRRFNWVVDLNTYKFYTKKTQQMLPLDFVVNHYLIGYINNVLCVKRNLSTKNGTDAKDDQPLKLWDRIISIDNISFKTMQTEDIEAFKQKDSLNFKILRKGQIIGVAIQT